MHSIDAIVAVNNQPLTQQTAFEQQTVQLPQLGSHDLLVKVCATSVNPVDTKKRAALNNTKKPSILGFDGVGEVIDLGSEVDEFKQNQRVYFAGDAQRPGANATYLQIDSRIVGNAPEKISNSCAAAMPLTSLTAWESLFEKSAYVPQAGANTGTVFIINGAGGVGSIAIQLAKWAGLQVVTTAGRVETSDWCKHLGADIVLDYHESLVEQWQRLGIPLPETILMFQSTDQYLPVAAQLIKPLGTIVAIVSSQQPLSMEILKDKGVKLAWESMFTKVRFHVNMVSQQHILNQVAQLLDDGIVRSTLTKRYTGFKVSNFLAAHQDVESGKIFGKVVIEY